MSWNQKLRGMPKTARETITIDATGLVFGRLATRIAHLLMGKHKPGMIPHIDSGDNVKIVNIKNLEFTGKKWDQKVFYTTSNRPGGLKTTPVSTLRANKPDEILRHAVYYMLPKNRTRNARLKRLTIS